MLVDKMTEEEVCKEILEDFNNITKSLRVYVPKVNRIVSKNRGRIPFNIHFNYVSP